MDWDAAVIRRCGSRRGVIVGGNVGEQHEGGNGDQNEAHYHVDQRPTVRYAGQAPVPGRHALLLGITGRRIAAVVRAARPHVEALLSRVHVRRAAAVVIDGGELKS